MRTLSVGVAPLALGLALCLSASAQAQDRNTNDRNQGNDSETRTIRGIIAGVTVAGETAVDFRTNRAVLVESSYLTIVGSEGNADQRRDQDRADRRDDQNERNDREAGDRQRSADHQRHNVYNVWMTPQTEIRKAGDRRRDGDRDAQNNPNAGAASRNATAMPFEALEVGDRVEVRFKPRNTASGNQTNANRRHGRHRTYFGDASVITILAGPGQNDRDRDSNPDRDRNQNPDRDRSKQSSDRDK